MKIKDKRKYFIIIGLIIFLDQLSKYWIKSVFNNKFGIIEVVKGFFEIKFVTNSGAVWGLFSEHKDTIIPSLITVGSIIALIVLVIYFSRLTPTSKFELWAMSFIIGGALGNITDRISQGYVVDFLDFQIGGYHWPTFNVADSFITIGVIILFLSIWRSPNTAQANIEDSA